MIKKLYPEDGPAFQRGLEQRREQVDVERLVQNVAYERRQREAVAERSREATRKAKDALARTQHIADEVARKVMREERRILATKHPWEEG